MLVPSCPRCHGQLLRAFQTSTERTCLQCGYNPSETVPEYVVAELEKAKPNASRTGGNVANYTKPSTAPGSRDSVRRAERTKTVIPLPTYKESPRAAS